MSQTSERVRRWEQDNLTPVERWARMRIRNLRFWSRKKDLPFNIKALDLIDRYRLAEGMCEFCKFKFTLETGDRSQSPEVDRIFPKLGYVIGNIQLLCRRDNMHKSDMDAKDIAQLLKWQLAAEANVQALLGEDMLNYLYI